MTFKLVLNLFTSDELYDRRNDPNEMHNLIDDIRFADVRSKMHDALLDYMDKIRDPFRSYQWSLRPWRKDALPRWMGAFRPRPQDGYSPVVRDYDTGLPTQRRKVEEKNRSSDDNARSMNTRRALFRLLKPVNRRSGRKNQEYQQIAARCRYQKQGMESQRPAAKTSAPRMPQRFSYAYRQ